jgi:hypothetical protein
MGPGGLPYIADNGRDDNSIAHLFDLSEPGAWADALQFVLFRVEPYEPQQCVFDPAKGGADTDASAFAPDLHAPFHSSTDTDERQHDHER